MRFFIWAIFLSIQLAAMPVHASESVPLLEPEVERVGLGVSPLTYIDFGTVDVNRTEYRYLRFENNTADPTTNIEIRLYGDSTFGGATDCEETLLPQEFCTIRIDFRPWHSGIFFGELTVDSDQFSTIVDIRGRGRDRR